MELRIRTWNCFGMGQGLDAVTHLRAPFPQRLRDGHVLAECASADVLCVQEILSRDAQQFFDRLARTHFVGHVRDDNRIALDGSMRGSGLGLGARSPLTNTTLRTFPGGRVGWDRLARKGALYAELSLEGTRPIDLLTVHLQAGYATPAARVRASQLVHLRKLIDDVGSRDRTFIVCGDFNIDGLARSRALPEYRALSEALEGFIDLGAESDLPTYHPHPDENGLAHAFEPDSVEQRVDYIFVRARAAGGSVRCRALTRFFDRPLEETTFAGGKAGWASDHFGLSAILEIET